MLFISHRGNISGKNEKRENSPEYINEAISLGFDVEVDIRITTGLQPPGDIYLGHDSLDYKVDLKWLIDRKKNLWLHAKNKDALSWFSKSSLGWNVFWHQSDEYTLTRRGNIWVYPGSSLPQGSICVMPEMSDYSNTALMKCGGICSDNIVYYREKFMKVENN